MNPIISGKSYDFAVEQCYLLNFTSYNLEKPKEESFKLIQFNYF